MVNRLSGKVALISGAARGQGAAEARLFVSEGAHVVLADVLDAEGEQVATALNQAAESRRALYVHLDVTQADQWEAAVAQAEREFGRVDVLVNNAGVLSTSGVEDTTEAEWQRVIDVNQKGVWLGMKAAVPALRRAGGGAIVNISSIYGMIGGSGGATAYHASKGAVRLLTKTAAVQYAPARIRVNSVHPGLITTPMVAGASEAQLEAMAALHPMKRAGTAEEIAYGVLYLASDEASFVTGAELVIDGGYTAV
jgi:NAD(P)-dependent dehydrogenase (short-subunit alcohol dehydrogenase family)